MNAVALSSTLSLKKVHILAFVCVLAVLLLCTPTQTKAAPLSETQVGAVVAVLNSFNVDAPTVEKVHRILASTTLATGSCVTLYSSFTLGVSGDGVARLQKYLGAKGYLSAEPTGYYGFRTAEAVGKLQVDLGIVASADDTAYGIMGPKTRGAIACKGEVIEKVRDIRAASTTLERVEKPQPLPPQEKPRLPRPTPPATTANTGVSVEALPVPLAAAMTAFPIGYYQPKQVLGLAASVVTAPLTLVINSLSEAIYSAGLY